MAKMVQLTQADGNPCLINAESVVLVITPNPDIKMPSGAKTLVYLGTQQMAVIETVAEVKAKL